MSCEVLAQKNTRACRGQVAPGATRCRNHGGPNFVKNDTFFYVCKRRDSVTALKMIADESFDFASVNKMHNTPLICAIEYEMYDVALALVKTGKSNPGAINIFGYTALLLLSYRTVIPVRELVLELIKTGESRPNYAPMHYPSAFDNFCQYSDTVPFLKEMIKAKDFDPLTRDNYDNIPITIACQYRCYEVVSDLLKITGCSIVYRGMPLYEWCLLEKFPEAILQEMFETLTDPSDIVRFLSKSTTGFKLIFSQLNIDKLITDIKSVDLRCGICQGFCFEMYTHICGAKFHQSCIESWATQNIGDVITIGKSRCPACQQSLDVSQMNVPQKGKILSTTEIESLPADEYHKVCKHCKKVFSCGKRDSAGCIAVETIVETTNTSQDGVTSAASQHDLTKMLPDKCERCEQRSFPCPNCGITLEHSGGCDQFVCCLKGRDKCEGSRCDHGSTDFARFCGHRWTLERRMLNGHYYDDSDHESDCCEDFDYENDYEYYASPWQIFQISAIPQSEAVPVHVPIADPQPQPRSHVFIDRVYTTRVPLEEFIEWKRTAPPSMDTTPTEGERVSIEINEEARNLPKLSFCRIGSRGALVAGDGQLYVSSNTYDHLVQFNENV